MLAQFSIWSLDQPHLSKDVAQITKILDQKGVNYQVNAMSTTVEGDWHHVMNAINACHNAMREAHARILTTIHIDDDATRALNMNESRSKVRARQEEAKQ
jgi:uncharacterized protein (TIGR00106 family)